MGRRLKVVPEARTDAMALLCDCHRRIEEHLEVLAVLLELPPEKALSESHKHAARAVIACFSKEKDCHRDDEERSLFPRVSASSNPHLGRARDLLSKLIEEHKQADLQHDQANAVLEKWIAAGKLSDQQRDELTRLHGQLREMYTRHIRDEATCVFRLASELLAPADLTAMTGEMMARRA